MRLLVEELVVEPPLKAMRKAVLGLLFTPLIVLKSKVCKP